MIRILLLGAIDWTNEHQRLMLAGAAAAILLGLAVCPTPP